MLTHNQKKKIANLDQIEPQVRAVIRSRVTKKAVVCIDDLTLLFDNAEKFPGLEKKISSELIQKLIDSYFKAYKVSTLYSDPKKVIELLDENAKLKRKNAALMQELGDMAHRVEHFKYMASHATLLLKESKQEKSMP